MKTVKTLKRSLLLLIASALTSLLLFATPIYARGPYYGGGKHSYSHGGSYPGGHGSSHKGGHYKNANTGNHYGRHKG